MTETLNQTLRKRIGAALTQDEIVTCRALGMAEDVYQTQHTIERVAAVPLTPIQVEACNALGTSPAQLLKRRNEAFAALWSAPVPTTLDVNDTRAVASLEAQSNELLRVTGAASLPEALLQVIEWRLAAEQVEQLEAMQRGLVLDGRDRALEQLSMDGIVAPVQHEYLRERFGTAAEVQAFVSGSGMKVSSLFTSSIREPRTAATLLTAEEHETCRLLGITAEAFAEAKPHPR